MLKGHSRATVAFCGDVADIAVCGRQSVRLSSPNGWSWAAGIAVPWMHRHHCDSAKASDAPVAQHGRVLPRRPYSDAASQAPGKARASRFEEGRPVTAPRISLSVVWGRFWAARFQGA